MGTSVINSSISPPSLGFTSVNTQTFFVIIANVLLFVPKKCNKLEYSFVLYAYGFWLVNFFKVFTCKTTLQVQVFQLQKRRVIFQEVVIGFLKILFKNNFPVLLRNRLIRTVLSHTEISCIASYYRQFSAINKIN